MNSRVDERVRKFSPRWELSLKADSCCIWAVGGGGGPGGGAGVWSLQRKKYQQGPEGERARCWQELLVTESSGKAGMDRGSCDTEN